MFFILGIVCFIMIISGNNFLVEVLEIGVLIIIIGSRSVFFDGV